MISEELPELIGMSDRILIMKDGQITKEFTRDPELSQEEIRAEVRRVIDTLGKGGGLMISSAVMFRALWSISRNASWVRVA